MRNAVFLSLLTIFTTLGQAVGHDLSGGNSLVDPSGFVETALYLVQYEYSDGALAEW